MRLPGCHVSRKQVPDTLYREYNRNYSLLTSSFALTRLLHWFTCVQLTSMHLWQSLLPFLLIAHNLNVSIKGCIRWFSDYSCKSSLIGLLSSVLKHQQLLLLFKSHTENNMRMLRDFKALSFQSCTNVSFLYKFSTYHKSPQLSHIVCYEHLIIFISICYI
jgi:hypothetical protein